MLRCEMPLVPRRCVARRCTALHGAHLSSRPPCRPPSPAARQSSSIPAAPAPRPFVPPRPSPFGCDRSARPGSVAFGRLRAVPVRELPFGTAKGNSGALGKGSAHLGFPRDRLTRLRAGSEKTRADSGFFDPAGRTARGLGPVRAGSGAVRYRFGPRRRGLGRILRCDWPPAGSAGPAPRDPPSPFGRGLKGLGTLRAASETLGSTRGAHSETLGTARRERPSDLGASPPPPGGARGGAAELGAARAGSAPLPPPIPSSHGGRRLGGQAAGLSGGGGGRGGGGGGRTRAAATARLGGEGGTAGGGDGRDRDGGGRRAHRDGRRAAAQRRRGRRVRRSARAALRMRRSLQRSPRSALPGAASVRAALPSRRSSLSPHAVGAAAARPKSLRWPCVQNSRFRVVSKRSHALVTGSGVRRSLKTLRGSFCSSAPFPALIKRELF